MEPDHDGVEVMFTGIIDDIISGAAGWLTDVLRNVVSALMQAVTEAVKWVSTYFLYLPAPVLQGEGEGWSPAERVQAFTNWAVIIGGMIGMAFALIMVARRRDADSAVDVVMGFFRVILVTGAGIPAISLLAKFFDEASPWLINNISGGTFEEGLGQLMGGDAAAASGMGVGTLVLMLIALLLGVLGGILNLFMVMFNWGVLPVVAGLLPVVAAAAMSPRGRSAFNRVIAWIAAILLFKPVAAVIYGVGIAAGRMITGGVEDSGQVVLQSLYGTVLLIAAGIALPAIARIVAPAVAAGTQGGGAGLLIGAGMVAAGAVTGGAAAVAAVGARGGGVAAGAGSVANAGAANPSGASMAPAASGGGSSGSAGAGSGGPSGAGSGSNGPSGGDAGGGSTGGGSSSGGGSTVSGAGSQGAAANRGSQFAKRWAANGAVQAQAQIGSVEQAVEAGDER